MSSGSNNGYDSRGLFITSSLLVIAGLLYLLYLNYESEKVLIPFSFVALLAGLFLEVGRVSKNWKTIWILVMVSCALSLFAFLPGDNNRVDIAEGVKLFPLVFCGLFTLMAIVWFENKFVPLIDESITMLQSMAIIYWLLDFGVLTVESLVVKLMFLIPLAFAGYSIYHAFSYTELKPKMRLILSIWSSIIMLAFSADNIWGAVSGAQIEDVVDFGDITFILIKYFLLGVSLVYILQNYMLLSEYLPSKSDRKKEYPKRVRILTKQHIDRFSTAQTKRSHALFALTFSIIVFGSNYYFQIVPHQMAIWSVFLVFPALLMIITHQEKK